MMEEGREGEGRDVDWEETRQHTGEWGEHVGQPIRPTLGCSFPDFHSLHTVLQLSVTPDPGWGLDVHVHIMTCTCTGEGEESVCVITLCTTALRLAVSWILPVHVASLHVFRDLLLLFFVLQHGKAKLVESRVRVVHLQFLERPRRAGVKVCLRIWLTWSAPPTAWFTPLARAFCC